MPTEENDGGENAKEEYEQREGGEKPEFDANQHRKASCQLSSLLDKKHDEDDDEPEEASLKVVVVGDPSCGKTALCTRFANHHFSYQYRPTQGVDFFSRRMQFPGEVGAMVEIWDVDGHSLAPSGMLGTYLYESNACLLVYDVSSTPTFDNLLGDWLPLVRRLVGQRERPLYFALVGNKVDLEHKRAVRVEQHTQAVEQHKFDSSFYVSAKTGDSVDLAFRAVVADVLGVKLSRAERERNINIVRAQIPVADSAASQQQAAKASSTAQSASKTTASSGGGGANKAVPDGAKSGQDNANKSANDGNKNSKVCAIQ